MEQNILVLLWSIIKSVFTTMYQSLDSLKIVMGTGEGSFSISFAILLPIIIVACLIFSAVYKNYNSIRIRLLARKCRVYSTEEIDSIASDYGGKEGDFQGIYIIRRKRIFSKYYVGQSVHVIERLKQHFSGRGCGDVYADYCNGIGFFTIKVIPLHHSGYKTLNDLERYAIASYKGYTHGYNKTRGNQTKGYQRNEYRHYDSYHKHRYR